MMHQPAFSNDSESIKQSSGIASSKQNIDFIDETIKDLVYGFIREIERLLSSSQQIPFVVSDICLVYYGIIDTWCREYGALSQIKVNNCFIQHISGETATAYGNMIIKQGMKFSWNIIIKKEVLEKNSCVYVGIIKNDAYLLKKHIKSAGWVGYNFDTEDGWFAQNDSNITKGKRYGKIMKFKKRGDILTVILDNKNKTLSYKVNGNERFFCSARTSMKFL